VSVTVYTAAECAALTLGDGTSSPTLTGSGTLTVWKDSSWNSGTMTGSGRTVIPPGVTLTIDNSPSVTLGRTLENGGTIAWIGSAGIFFGNAVLTNRVGALFVVQNSAEFSFSSGANRFDNAGTFRKASTSTPTVAHGSAFQ